MNPLDALLHYFPTGTSEGEKAILKEAFITPSQMSAVLAVPPGSPRIIIGNKGIGKSAILESLLWAAGRQGIPALLICPDDLDTQSVGSATDIAATKRVMYDCILHAVAVRIGRDLKGLLTGSAAALYEEAVQAKARDRDFTGRIFDIVAHLSKPVVKVDAMNLAHDLGRGGAVANLSEVVQEHLLNVEKVFLLLIDDTDQVASPADPNHLNRIWGLLLAARRVVQECPNIRCFVTLRSEVWSRLTRNDKGQRDQTDHIRPLIEHLRASDDYMLQIFRRRTALAAKRLNKPDELKLFFNDKDVKLPTSTETRSWSSFLLKSSRERPRDLIQLVGHLAREAKKAKRAVITSDDANTAMQDYSKERAVDLAVEVGDDCPVFLDVLRSFAEVDFELTFEELRKHISSVPSRFSTHVRGRVLRPEREDDFVALLDVLYESGFINARLPDTSQPRGFRHVTFLDDSHFITPSRWNDMQAARWEIHPAFRTYLLGLKQAKARRHR